MEKYPKKRASFSSNKPSGKKSFGGKSSDKRKSFSSDRPYSKSSSSDRPFRKNGEGGGSDRPYVKREGGFDNDRPRTFSNDRPAFKKREFENDRPFVKREGGFDNDRPRKFDNDRPAFKKREFDNDRPPAFKKREFDNDRPFVKREGGFDNDRPRRENNDRPAFKKREFENDRPFVKREGGFDNDRPRRENNDRPDFKKREFGDKPFVKREGNDFYGTSDEKKPFERREGGFGGNDRNRNNRPEFQKRSSGERRPFRVRETSEERAFYNSSDADDERSGGSRERRSSGGDRNRSDRPRRENSDRPAFKKRESGEDRPFVKKEKTEGDDFYSSSDEKPNFRERKPFTERKENTDRPEFKKREFGENRPFVKRESGFDNDRPRKFDTDRPDFKKKTLNEDKPFQRREEGGFERPRKFEQPEKKTFLSKKDDGFSNSKNDSWVEIPYDKKEARELFESMDSDAPRKRAEPTENFKTSRKKTDKQVIKTPDYNLPKSDESRPNNRDRKKMAKEGVDADGLIRLNRYIANAGVCSRREADVLIADGEIKVNGVVITEMGHKVSPTDVVKKGNKVLKKERMVYVLLNKPKDHLTTVDDPEGRKTVMNLVRTACEERIYPIGRLDRNTTGLLILTNDGDLAKKLSHPSYDVKKIYQVEIDQAISDEHYLALQTGVNLEDGMAKADRLDALARNVLMVEIHNGKNRIIRRMFEHLGYKVVNLDRVSFAGLSKKGVPRGNWRYLDEKEVINLKHF
ncbi:MAG: pseudouridine synthase [Bacteroidetes bacterium]|nr:MAG: pseudouridine synthase [Bacteroidota bacterium]